MIYLYAVADCLPGICANGGECVHEGASVSCACLPGFTGDRCQVTGEWTERRVSCYTLPLPGSWDRSALGICIPSSYF